MFRVANVIKPSAIPSNNSTLLLVPSTQKTFINHIVELCAAAISFWDTTNWSGRFPQQMVSGQSGDTVTSSFKLPEQFGIVWHAAPPLCAKALDADVGSVPALRDVATPRLTAKPAPPFRLLSTRWSRCGPQAPCLARSELPWAYPAAARFLHPAVRLSCGRAANAAPTRSLGHSDLDSLDRQE